MKKRLCCFCFLPFFLTIFSPEDKVYIFTNTVFVIGKTDARKLRYSINGVEGPTVESREGNFHFMANLNNGLNKIEISDEEKIQLEIFSTNDSTGLAGFNRYIFHTGKKDGLCKECHAMDPAKADRKMCFDLCHKSDVMKWGYMHGPAGEGACLACHDSGGGNNGYEVVVGGGQICITCHEKIGSVKRYVHTAVSRRLCTGCHSPHGTVNDFVLREDGRAKMCYLCHKEGEMVRYPHKAVSDGDCLGCHHPHESDSPYGLRQPAGKLCVETECHNRISKAISKHPHRCDLEPANGSPVKIQENIFLDDKGGVVCYSCHNPHGSDSPFILWMPKERLCPRCHPNIEQLDEKSLDRK